jgi:hypothetical protein
MEINMPIKIVHILILIGALGGDRGSRLAPDRF